MGVCMSVDEYTLQIQCGPRARARRKLKNQIVVDFLGAEAKALQLLSQFPGRISTNGATQSSCIFSKQGRKGINQDCMIVWEGFTGRADTVFCGVFDGHGPSGHLVARKVRDSLPSLLNWPADSDPQSLWDNGDANNVAQDEKVPEFTRESDWLALWKEKMLKAYKRMDLNLKAHPKLNCSRSGTTAVTMVVQDKDLIVGNVGDSRAILARRREDGSLIVDQLTVDLKPDLPGELERIKACKGRVFALEDEPRVARVWQPHSDTPGLAMSRALGDFCLKNYGLSGIPEVSYKRLAEEDEFIVLATDGVWDVLSNGDVVAIVSSASPKEDAAKCLVDAAVKAWKRKHPTIRMDDCTVVCHFLKDKLTPSFTNLWKESAKVEVTMKTNANVETTMSLDDHVDMILCNPNTKATLVSYDTLFIENGVDYPNDNYLDRGV